MKLSQYAYYIMTEQECARDRIHLHITHMNRIALFTASALLIFACGSSEESALTPEETRMISDAAGMLARNLAFLPDSTGWSPMPDGDVIYRLETLSHEHLDLWPLFFRAAADTSAKLEQLQLQEQQELQQFELL